MTVAWCHGRSGKTKMGFYRSIYCRVAWGLILAAIAGCPNFATGQDIATLAKKVESERVTPLERLSYALTEYELFQTRKGERTLLAKVTTSRMSETRWRCDSVAADGLCKIEARNGGLFFTAIKPAGSKIFRETMMGYDSVVATVSRNDIGEFNKLAWWSTSIGLLDLVEFLNLSGIELISLTPAESPTGRRAEKFVWRNSEIKPDSVQHGEAIWLPEEGYLIESYRYWYEDKPASVASQVNSYAEFDGELVIQEGVMHYADGDTSMSLKLNRYEPPIGLRSYYSPQAIGLSAPWNPLWTKVFWALAGIVFMSGGFYAFRRLRTGK